MCSLGTIIGNLISISISLTTNQKHLTISTLSNNNFYTNTSFIKSPFLMEILYLLNNLEQYKFDTGLKIKFLIGF